MDAVSSGLSIRQKELVSRQLAEPATCALNVGTYCEIDGSLDPLRFLAAIERVVDRFDSLRVVLRAGGSEPVLVWLDTLGVAFENIDVGDMTHASAWIARDMQRPFAIYDSPFYRFALLRISPVKWVFYAGFHHLLVDGWAMGLITDRVLAEYGAIEAGTSVEAQYASARVLYAAQAKYAESASFAKDATFWRERLTDHPGPMLRKVREGCGGDQVVVPVRLARTTLAALLSRAGVDEEAEAPLLLALLYGFFGRSAAREDVVFGMSLLNRRGAEELNAAGLAVSAVPLRVRTGFSQSLATVVRAISQELRSVYRHHRFPLGEMARLHAQGQAEADGLFDVAVSLLAKPYVKLHLESALVGRQTQVFSNDAQLPMQVFIDSHDPALPVFISFVCDPEHFLASALERLPERFIAYAEALATSSTLEAATRIDTAERRMLLAASNGGEEVIDFSPLHERVTHWAQMDPARAALVMDGQTLSYSDIELRTDVLAERLFAHGVGIESKVGVLLPRSLDLPIAMLGIQRAGAVYLPLDPEWPAERMRYVLSDANVDCLLTTLELADRFGDLGVTVLHAYTPELVPPGVPARPFFRAAISPANLAYVIYTSGTTGKPKGVGLTHGGLSTLAHALQCDFGIGSDDAVLQFARACFDASVFEMTAALANGAALHLADNEAARSPEALAVFMVERSISVATLPPSLLPALSRHGFPALRLLVVAGEACSAETAALWRSRCRMINAYGPTETTVCATFGAVEADGAPPIGKALVNTQAYVLDASLELVPLGEQGVLYVGGALLARGYLNRSGLSAERFVADPFGRPGGRLYCTGDVVRSRADGSLEFLGRADHQIKLRGFRVELSEIETAIRTCDEVADAVVISYRHPSGESTLIAYCVGHTGELPLASLRAQLAATLPDYMVPSQFVQLAALPLNGNGKVDRNALVLPGQGALADNVPTTRTGSVESEIEAIWAELLHLPRVSIDRPFFEVGGSSLLLGQVLNAIEARLGVKLEIMDLIKHSTIRSLAQHVDGLKHLGNRGERAIAAKLQGTRGGIAQALGLRK